MKKKCHWMVDNFAWAWIPDCPHMGFLSPHRGEEKGEFRKEVTEYISKVHGKVKRTTLYRQDKTERELGFALGELLHKGKNVVGCGFRGKYAFMDESVK